jgi:hypothetical protein
VDYEAKPKPELVAGLFKLYLRELPEPLLTFSLYTAFLSASGTPHTFRLSLPLRASEGSPLFSAQDSTERSLIIGMTSRRMEQRRAMRRSGPRC